MIRRLPELRRELFLWGTGLSRLVDEFFRDFDRVGFDVSPSLGRTDIYEEEQSIVYDTELPGMKKGDIEIKVEDDKLVISGEVKRSEEIKEDNYFRVGRRYGRIQRCFPLPADIVSRENIKARFEDGILRVTVPMKESLKERERPIEVKVE